MQLAQVIGRATSTVKHPSLEGWRMLLVQPLGMRGTPDGEPLLAIDDLGAGRGDKVMITSDGASVREMMGTDNTPVRWAILGIADEQDQE
jgi:microcompartment protein CcmK/EutM